LYTSSLTRGYGHSFQDDISKKNSTESLQWADFQGFALPGPLAECAMANRKGFAKPLKMRPRPLNAIDVVLKRMAVTGRLSLHLTPPCRAEALSLSKGRRRVCPVPSLNSYPCKCFPKCFLTKSISSSFVSTLSLRTASRRRLNIFL